MSPLEWVGAIKAVLVAVGIAAWIQWAFRRSAAQEKCILDLLAGPEAPLYGLELIERSAGLLSRGTVYVLLGRLQDRGLVEATLQDSDGRRRYRLVNSESGLKS